MKKTLLLLLMSLFAAGRVPANIFDNIALVKKINSCELITKDVASTTIPFTIERGRLIIEVEVSNGKLQHKKERFILDTGAPTLFTVEYAKEQGFAMDPVDVKTATPTGQKKASEDYLTSAPTLLKVGDMELQYEHNWVTNINIPDVKCLNTVGLIGSRLLSEFVVTFDFKNNTLTLTQKDKFDYKSIGSYAYKFGLHPLIIQKQPMPHLTINGKDIDGTFDTGFPGTLLLQYESKNADKMSKIAQDAASTNFETYALLGDKDGDMKEKVTMYNWSGASFTNIENEKIAVDEGLVCVNNNLKKNQLYIGLRFMSQYDKMILDWNKNDIYLFSPQASPVDKYIPGDICLKLLDDDHKYVIGSINTKAPLYAKGLRAGDQVISINGAVLTPADGSNTCAILKDIKQLGKDVRSIVVSRNGQQVTITN